MGVLSEASAHIDLLEPEARAHGTAARGDTDIDANSNLKQGPCGQVVPGRTERVATYGAGETITVRVREENAHVSYIRVSIDLDGADFLIRDQTPPGPETQAEAAAAEAALNVDGLLAVYREDNDTPGFVHEIEVTLPQASCDNCTLQVLQYMYDDPAAPYYFQCADLVITPPGEPVDAGLAGEDGPRPLDGADSDIAVAPPRNNPGTDSVANTPAGADQGASPPRADETGVSVPAASSESIGAVARSGGSGCSLPRQVRDSALGAASALLVLCARCVRRRIQRAPH